MTSKKILDIINDESKIFSIQELGKITLELRKDVCREQKEIAEKTDVKSKAKKIWLSGEENAFKIILDLCQRSSNICGTEASKSNIEILSGVAWVDRAGTQFTLRDISDDYLINIIGFVVRGGGYREYRTLSNIQTIYDEAINRGLKPIFSWKEVEESIRSYAK